MEIDEDGTESLNENQINPKKKKPRETSETPSRNRKMGRSIEGSEADYSLGRT